MPHSENPSAVPTTMPVISPMAHPVRQWRVALKRDEVERAAARGERAVVMVVE